MKNEKQIIIDGYKCIKLDEWKTEWKAEKVKYVIGKAEDEEFPLFYAKVQRVNDNDDLIDDDYIFEYDNKPKRSEVEDDFIDEWGQRDLDRRERKMPVPENDIIHMICI
jgi:hypothetical protein